jgi:hypothetical protein
MLRPARDTAVGVAQFEPVRACRLISTVGAAVLIGGAGAAAARAGSGPPRPVGGGGITWTQRSRPARPDKADWERIRAAAGLRRIALEPHRSAHFRAFAAFLGLSELVTIHPLGAGRCATAVVYLYDNLLDLQDAYPGENWNPLRRLVAKEPSIRACAPPDRRRIGP